MSDAVLRLTGIAKTYNTGRPNEVAGAARRRSDVATGEMVALVAPSGAGKSTLAAYRRAAGYAGSRDRCRSRGRT